MTDMPADGDESPVNAYTDPELYDAENTVADEVPMLLRLARLADGPILDLACGTGRTTLPLAEAGFEVIGVDASEAMVGLARRKANELGLPVTFHVQDCRMLDVPTVAGMETMTGNAFQEFLSNEDQDGLLRAVHRHLSPGGVFVFGTRLPSHLNLDRPAGEQPWSTVTDDAGRRIEMSVIWSYDPVSQIQDYTFIERIHDGSRPVEERRSPGRLRYTGPMEMRRLLAAHGFETEAMEGGWAGGVPLTADAAEMVVTARRGS